MRGVGVPPDGSEARDGSDKTPIPQISAQDFCRPLAAVAVGNQENTRRVLYSFALANKKLGLVSGGRSDDLPTWGKVTYPAPRHADGSTGFAPAAIHCM